jgi:hypothetical protein
MEAKSSSETWDCPQAARIYNPEDSTFHGHRREHPKSNYVTYLRSNVSEVFSSLRFVIRMLLVCNIRDTLYVT